VAPPGPLAPPRDAALLAGLAVGATLAAWASAFVAIRGVGTDISPGALALGRLLVGTLVLGALLLPRGWVAPTRRQWALLAVCGIGWFGVYNVALNAAEQTLDAGTTAMLVNIGPILIAVLAGLVLGEGFPPRLVTGIAVAFAGVLLIGWATRGSGADLTGVLLCVLAATTYAVGVVAQKPVLRGLPPLQVTFTACAIGALCCLPWAGALGDDLATAPASSVAGMVYLGVVPTALAFSTWAYALARMDAGTLGVTTYLVPPLVILLAWVLLDEVPPPLAVAGGVVCLAGVGWARSRSRRPSRRREPVPQEAGPAR
jgi:drug/metabolite transporter (DMT)-like permease